MNLNFKGTTKRQWMVLALLFAVWLYLGISHTRYRLRHPEMTETQIGLHRWDVLTWKD